MFSDASVWPSVHLIFLPAAHYSVREGDMSSMSLPLLRVLPFPASLRAATAKSWPTSA